MSLLSWIVVDYVFSPRIFLTHVIGACLLYSLARQNTERKQVISIALLQELAVFSLWLVFPYGLGTIAAIWFCVYLYEDALGTRINIHSNVHLVSDFDISEAFRDIAGVLNYDGAVDEETGQFKINSATLQIAELANQKLGIEGGAFKLSDIARVDSKFDDALKRSLRRIQVDPERCFLATTSDNQSAVLIAESRDARNQWMTVMRNIVGDVAEDVAKEWLRRLLNQDGEVTVGGSLIGGGGGGYGEGEGGVPDVHVGLEDALTVLNKIKRPVDHKYLAELFKIASKSSATKTSNGKLNFDQFLVLFKQAAIQPEIQQIFTGLLDSRSNELSLRPASVQRFMLNDQKERVTKEQVQNWINQNEPVLRFYNFSSAGLANYLMSEEHTILNRDHRPLYQDMDQPLAHYFIATSHNTYLTKDQLKSKSSVDAYINAFKRGCKCVELDCWDGPNNEPIIYHGHTLTSKILFRDVIRGIKDFAFVVSDFPVILSFENHCTVEQQKVMAQHLKTILGDKLYTKPIPENETRLPSPNDLRGYVIVKAKKLKPGVEDDGDEDDDFSDDDGTEEDLAALDADKPKDEDIISIASEDFDEDEDLPPTEKIKEHKQSKIKSLWHSVENLRQKAPKEKAPSIAQELSDLVVYCQATHFKGFEYSRLHSKYYEMSSFGEAKAMKFAKSAECRALLEYNKRQLSRIYPAGARIDSSNYNPTTLWNAGCQLVALNYQTACREMQLNQGLFQINAGCGYVLKPPFMREDHSTFDPRGPFTAAQTMSVRVISAHQLPHKTDRSVKSERHYQVYVKVAGVEEDVQSLRTKPLKNNGYNPTWDEVLVFKIHVPELSLVTFSVCTRTVVAQFTLPYTSIQQGYRRVPLTDKHAVPLPNSYLIVRTDISAI